MKTKCRLQLATLSLAVLGALAGCAGVSLPAPGWSIAPVRHVSHGGVTGDESTARAYAALARQYEGEGRTEAAIEAWRKAIAQDAANAELHNSLGMALAARGRYDDAVLSFGRAEVFAPRDARILNNLGYSQLMAGQHAGAVRSLEQALALDPHHAKSRANLDAARLELARTERTVVRLAGGEEISVPSAMTSQGASVPVSAAEVLRERVYIVNGNGVPGTAARMRDIVRERGITDTRLANLPRFDAISTRVIYREGYAGYARQVARRLPLSSEIAPADPGESNASPVRVVIGHDARTVAACARLGGCLQSFDVDLRTAASDEPLSLAALQEKPAR